MLRHPAAQLALQMTTLYAAVPGFIDRGYYMSQMLYETRYMAHHAWRIGGRRQ